jgi:hypothetical protein
MTTRRGRIGIDAQLQAETMALQTVGGHEFVYQYDEG